MYALGIPNRQYRRCTQVLGHERSEPIPYESSKQDDGFWLFTFPEADEYDFRDIVILLKGQGVSTIGADTQLTEKKIMKLTDLLKEHADASAAGNPDENNMIDILQRTLDSWGKPTYMGGTDYCERSNQYQIDLENIIEDYKEEAEEGSDFDKWVEDPYLEEEDVDEGTCGYSKDGKKGNKPASSKLGFTKRELNEGRLQQLAGIKPLYEENFDHQNFDDKLANAMGMSGDEFEDQVASRDVGSPFLDMDDDMSPGAELASRTIEKLRQQYRGMSDQDMDDFSKEMIEHFLDNTAAQSAAKVFFGKRGI